MTESREIQFNINLKLANCTSTVMSYFSVWPVEDIVLHRVSELLLSQ